MFLRLWLRSLSVRRSQPALAVLSVFMGAVVASALLNLYGDVRRKMNQEFRAYGPNVILASAATSRDSVSASGVIGEEVIPSLERFRSSRLTAVPVLYVVTRVKRVSTDVRLPQIQNTVAVGADFSALRRLHPAWHLESGDHGVESGTCIVGAQLASRLRVHPGDTVEIGVESQSTLRAGLGPARTKTDAEGGSFPVASLLSTGASEDNQVFIPLASLQHGAGLEGKISLVEISVPGERAEVERVIGKLSETFPDLDVRPVREIIYSEGKVLETIRWLLLLLTGLILVIMALCIAATMTAIVLERRKDVAVMKALGASDQTVMRLFLTEGAALGLAGGFGGFIFGLVLAQHLAQRLFGVTLKPVWWTLPAICLSMAVLAVLATAFPVRMVRGVEPARVLKGE